MRISSTEINNSEDKFLVKIIFSMKYSSVSCEINGSVFHIVFFNLRNAILAFCSASWYYRLLFLCVLCFQNYFQYDRSVGSNTFRLCSSFCNVTNSSKINACLRWCAFPLFRLVDKCSEILLFEDGVGPLVV